MPAHSKEPDVLVAVRSFGVKGGTLSEIASAAGVGVKAARKHLNNLTEAGVLIKDKVELPPFYRFWVAKEFRK